MEKIYLLFFLFLVATFSCAQENKLSKVLYDQVEAFNNQNVGKLVENVSDDFKYFYISSNELIKEVEGKEDFKKSMEAYFNSGIKVFSEIKSYTIVGNRISFKEVVSYLNKKGEWVYSSSLGVYQIVDKKITRAWYFIQ